MAKQETAAFLQFMEEYAGYMEKVGGMEADKRAALLSNQVDQIERSLQQQQAVVMQLGNMEKRRAELQGQCGFDGLTFREIAARLEDGERERAEEILRRLEAAVGDVKFNNDKAMDIARDKIKIISQVMPEELLEAEAYAPPAQKAARPAAKTFETKI